jgi:hypothetical protein
MKTGDTSMAARCRDRFTHTMENGDVGTSAPLRFRSKWTFLVMRGAMLCVIPVFVAVTAVKTEGPVGATSISILMLAVILGVIYRLLRACLIVDEVEFISRGFFRDRHFPRSQVVGFVVDPTWYTWRRLVVPARVFLVSHGGKRVRVPGVQCHIGNVGVAHVPIGEEIERSYPQVVADQLNLIINGPTASFVPSRRQPRSSPPVSNPQNANGYGKNDNRQENT